MDKAGQLPYAPGIVKRAWPIAALMFIGCGPTIGDPCTTARDCLNKLCLDVAGTPGGYCTEPCTLADNNACPTGSACIANSLGSGSAGCFRTCKNSSECRQGYQCMNQKDSSEKICIGPRGL